jgi:hypothetical protein
MTTKYALRSEDGKTLLKSLIGYQVMVRQEFDFIPIIKKNKNKGNSFEIKDEEEEKDSNSE